MNRKFEIHVKETKTELEELQRKMSKVNAGLNIRIQMLINIKEKDRRNIISLAADLGKNRKTISSWIVNYNIGGIDGLLHRNYESNKRSRNRKCKIMNDAVVKEINMLLYNPNSKFKSKRELYEHLKINNHFDASIRELNESTFYKRMEKIIPNNEFKQIMSNKQLKKVRVSDYIGKEFINETFNIDLDKE